MPKLVEGYADKMKVPDKLTANGKPVRDVLAFDTEVRGFGIRKYADGRASYFVKYTVKGMPKRLTLGPVVKGNLKKMRERAEEVRARARLGEDIVGDQKTAAAEQEAIETAATVGALVKVFLKEREEQTRKVRDGRPVTPTLRYRTHEQNARYLTEHCAPLHHLVVGTVTRGAEVGVVDVDKKWTPINGHKLEIVSRSHVVAVVDDVARTRGKVSADRCKTALSTFYAWAIDAGFADSNPSMHIKNRAANGSRERTLNDQELAQVWRACGDDEYGKIVRLLLLTGCRKLEIGDLVWSELHLGERVIKLPADRVKNKRAHTVWLCDEALAILKGLSKSDTRELVFGRGAGGFGGWSLAKTALEKRIGEPLPHWTLHDLRRSFSTRANELGLGPPHMIEACLNHAIGGVHGTYNRADYERGRREVWEAWGRHVAKLVSQPQTAIAAKPRRSASRGNSVTAA